MTLDTFDVDFLPKPVSYSRCQSGENCRQLVTMGLGCGAQGIEKGLCAGLIAKLRTYGIAVSDIYLLASLRSWTAFGGLLRRDLGW